MSRFNWSWKGSTDVNVTAGMFTFVLDETNQITLPLSSLKEATALMNILEEVYKLGVSETKSNISRVFNSALDGILK